KARREAAAVFERDDLILAPPDDQGRRLDLIDAGAEGIEVDELGEHRVGGLARAGSAQPIPVEVDRVLVDQALVGVDAAEVAAEIGAAIEGLEERRPDPGE